MTAKELAKLLDGRRYGEELSREDRRTAHFNGLVVCLGSSDDIFRIDGAIHAEVGALRSVTVQFDTNGLLPMFDELINDYPAVGYDPLATFRDFFNRERQCVQVTCQRDDTVENTGPLWTITTKIPHEKFTIKNDDDDGPFCAGIVFRLCDAKPAT